MRALFAPDELKGKSVYRSQKKTPLEHAHVEQIKQLLVIVYGETKITDKVWSESIASMNASYENTKRKIKRAKLCLRL